MHTASVSSLEAAVIEWIGFTALAIEVLAVVVIVASIVHATVRFLWPRATGPAVAERFTEYKHRLGRALLIGLEILVAADVVRTVALEPTLANVTVLGVLVLIRTFLSWSLSVEIEGHWPWHPCPDWLQRTDEGAKIQPVQDGGTKIQPVQGTE